ncbi:MAG: 1,4-dihydroxy-2-naphthoate polyprenyltransferase [Firmicutes bacterium]|nr:1,4-dihydroxy-2-naphthoate polyprenyltransferase [Alicyclobacillaceae bacterium]MCL6496753.1 1,4-dihydroxy-2-naphthoate polyprenyltransferase [Bacillota bacterium]
MLLRRVRIGWKLFRPLTLTASLVPVLAGTVLGAERAGHFRPGLFLVFLGICLLMQGATNMFNEYYDWRRGLDTAESLGIAGAIVRDGVPPKAVWLGAWTAVALAVAGGLWLGYRMGSWLWWLGGLSVLAGWSYSGGPRPVAYGPFGELVVAVFMGPFILGVAYDLQAGHWGAAAWLDSGPIALLVAAILFANNLRDLDQDRARGRRTLAIGLGMQRGWRFLAMVYLVAGLWTVGLILAGYLTWGGLLAVLAAPTAWHSLRAFRHGEGARGMALTAQTHLQYGLALVGGLFLAGLTGGH